MDSNPTAKLNELILLAGGQAKLADMLGVSQQNVHNWKKAGQISKVGAILVYKSVLLSQWFDPQELRPDLTDDEVFKLQIHDWFVDARIRQMRYESNPEFAETTLFYLQSRLDLLEVEE